MAVTIARVTEVLRWPFQVVPAFLMEFLEKKGVCTGVHYLPIYKHPVYQGIDAECPVAEKIWKKIITLPLYPDMDEKVAKVVIDSVLSFEDGG